MFQHIRRHQKWLWIVISGAVIASFVIYFTPDAKVGMGSRGGSVDYGRINGRPVTQKDLMTAYTEARLRYLFAYGNWPGNDEFGRQMGFDLNTEAENRLFLAEKIRELGIQVSDQEVGDWIAEMFSDRQTKTFKREAYEQFVQARLGEQNIKESTFQDFVRHEIAVGHLIFVAGMSGHLVPPREAEARYRRDHEQMTASVLTFSISNYLAGVTLDQTALMTFYTNRMAEYRLPERVAVNYVRFDATNFFGEVDQQFAKITNYVQMVESEYAKRGADSFKDAAGKVLDAEAAKAQIRQEHRMEAALVAARRKASTFVEELLNDFENGPTKGKTDLLELKAAAKGMAVAATAPFSQREGPREMRTMATFGQVAFKLNAEEPYSNPVPDEETVYVLSLKQRLPSENPPFDTVRDRVTESFRRNQALEAARSASRTLQSTLSTGLAGGRKFEDLCAEAKVSAVKVPGFSLATTSLPAENQRIPLMELKNIASALAPGKLSESVTTRDGAMLVYLHERLPADESKMKAELPAFLKTLREGRNYEAFNEWFRKEKELAHLIGLPTQRARKETAE